MSSAYPDLSVEVVLAFSVPGEVQDPALGGVGGRVLEQELKDVVVVVDVVDWTHLVDAMVHSTMLKLVLNLVFGFCCFLATNVMFLFCFVL